MFYELLKYLFCRIYNRLSARYLQMKHAYSLQKTFTQINTQKNELNSNLPCFTAFIHLSYVDFIVQIVLANIIFISVSVALFVDWKTLKAQSFKGYGMSLMKCPPNMLMEEKKKGNKHVKIIPGHRPTTSCGAQTVLTLGTFFFLYGPPALPSVPEDICIPNSLSLISN